nr:hypothetical protein [Prosthecochloris sp. SCSIO W1102]
MMLYVSFAEILPEAQASILEEVSERKAAWITTAAFFGGITLIWIIDQLMPHFGNPHETSLVGTIESDSLTKASSTEWVFSQPLPLPFTIFRKVLRFSSVPFPTRASVS